MSNKINNKIKEMSNATKRSQRTNRTADLAGKKKAKHTTPKDILEYQTAFDNVDLNKVFELIDFEPHDGQKKAIEKYNRDDVNTLVLVCGRRWGKSMLVSAVAVARLLLPNASIILFSATFQNASNIFKETFKLVQRTGIEITARNNANLSFSLENGASFYSISEKNYNSVLGMRVSTVIVDEVAIINSELLETVIGQNLSPAGSTFGMKKSGIPYFETILISSPRGAKGYFYEQYIKGTSGNYPNIVSIQSPTSENNFVPPEFLEQKKKELPKEIYDTEYLGLFNKDADSTVFHSFSRDTNVIDTSEIVPFITQDSIMIAGIDLGYGDMSAYLLIYVDSMGTYYVLEEYARAKLDVERHVEMFKDIEQRYAVKPEIRYIDPSTKLIAVTMANSFDYSTFPGRNEIQPSIDLINSLLLRKKLLISNKCEMLISTLDELEYKDGFTLNSRDPFKKLSKKLGHGDTVAALRYAVYTHHLHSGSFHGDGSEVGIVI
jgi:hypothetical protein